jgi:hypothetical protein
LNKLRLATLRFRFRHSVEKNSKDTDSGREENVSVWGGGGEEGDTVVPKLPA